MPDKINQVGGRLGRVKRDIDHVLTRNYTTTHLIERTRDVLDSAIPLEFFFTVPYFEGKFNDVVLELQFFHSGPAQNCAGSFCAQCDVWSGSNTLLDLTHVPVSGTLRVFYNDLQTTDYTTPTSSEVLLGFTPASTDTVKVCYLWNP